MGLKMNKGNLHPALEKVPNKSVWGIQTQQSHIQKSNLPNQSTVTDVQIFMDKDVNFSTVVIVGRKKTKAIELTGFLQEIPLLGHGPSKQKLPEIVPDMSWHQ